MRVVVFVFVDLSWRRWLCAKKPRRGTAIVKKKMTGGRRMKRIPPPGSHPGGGSGPAGTACTRRHRVARRTSSTKHIHPPLDASMSPTGRPVHERTHIFTRLLSEKCHHLEHTTAVRTHKRDQRRHLAILSTKSGKSRLGRAGRCSRVLFLMRRRKWRSSSHGTCPLKMEFWFSAKATKHTGCLPTTRRSMIWNGSMVF